MNSFEHRDFTRKFQEFKEEVAENNRELAEVVEKERELKQEIEEAKQTIQKDTAELAHLVPKERQLAQEKIKIHGQLQDMERMERQNINEHLSDKSKMIRPTK